MNFTKSAVSGTASPKDGDHPDIVEESARLICEDNQTGSRKMLKKQSSSLHELIEQEQQEFAQ